MEITRTQQIFAFVVFGFFIVFSLAAVMGSRSQQWEYMTVLEERTAGQKWVVRMNRMGDGEVLLWGNFDEGLGYYGNDWMNKAGADGWELVSHKTSDIESSEDDIYYFFKRPKQ